MHPQKARKTCRGPGRQRHPGGQFPGISLMPSSTQLSPDTPKVMHSCPEIKELCICCHFFCPKDSEIAKEMKFTEVQADYKYLWFVGGLQIKNLASMLHFMTWHLKNTPYQVTFSYERRNVCDNHIYLHYLSVCL